MTDAALNITLSKANDVTDPYWLRMELFKEPDSTMTVGEAAKVIDALFNISPCSTGKVQNPVPKKPDGSAWDKALRKVDLTECQEFNPTDDPGSYDVKVKIFRSHQQELYKLIMTNGSVKSLFRQEQEVFHILEIKGVSSVLLDEPVADLQYGRGYFKAWWTDIDGPEINRKGNTLWWEGAQTGTIRVEYWTVYDVADIHVKGERTADVKIITGTDGSWVGASWYSGSEDAQELKNLKHIECTVIAFYHYQYSTLTLNPPEKDESVTDSEATEICEFRQLGHSPGDTGFGQKKLWSVAKCKESCKKRYPDEANASERAACERNCERVCYREVEYEKICKCGGEVSVTTRYEEVVCPDGWTTGAVVNRRNPDHGVTTYEFCDDPKKERDYNASQGWFYEEKCCEPWDFGHPMPECVLEYSAFMGFPPTDDDIKQYKIKYGEDTNYIPVGPPYNGRCGDYIVEQLPFFSNCCDGVTALVWDDEFSVDLLADNSDGLIRVTGGTVPLTIKVRGNGFYLDSRRSYRDGVTENNVITIYTGNACGVCTVTMTDGCSTVTGQVLSTNGSWSADINGTAATGMVGVLYDHSGAFVTYYGDDGPVRQWERRYWAVGCGSSAYCSTFCYDYMVANTPCPLAQGTAYGDCISNGTVFSNKEIAYWNSPECVAAGNEGLLAAAAGYSESFRCSCKLSNWYQLWQC